jgi:hypothetical protein
MSCLTNRESLNSRGGLADRKREVRHRIDAFLFCNTFNAGVGSNPLDFGQETASTILTPTLRCGLLCDVLTS